MIDGIGDLERAVAAEFSEAWNGAWPVLADGRRIDRNEALARSRRLLALSTTTMLACTQDPEYVNLPLSGAMSGLVHVGEGFAIASQEWPIDDIEHPAMPTRAAVGQLIHQFEVEPWCRTQGYELTFVEIPERSWIDELKGHSSAPDNDAVAAMAREAMHQYHRVRTASDQATELDWEHELRASVAAISRQREAAGAVLARVMTGDGSAEAAVAIGTVRILGDMRFQIAANAANHHNDSLRDQPPTLAAFIDAIGGTGMDEALEAMGINLAAPLEH